MSYDTKSIGGLFLLVKEFLNQKAGSGDAIGNTAVRLTIE
jgi:hypothetical protein